MDGTLGAAQLGGARGFLSPGGAAVGRLVVGVLAWPAVLLLFLLALGKPCGLPGFGLGDERLNERNTGAAGQRAAGLRGRGEIETVERKRGEGGEGEGEGRWRGTERGDSERERAAAATSSGSQQPRAKSQKAKSPP